MTDHKRPAALPGETHSILTTRMATPLPGLDVHRYVSEALAHHTRELAGMLRNDMGVRLLAGESASEYNAPAVLDEHARTLDSAAVPDASQQREVTHQGPHPEHGGLETHIGTRDTCSGPDCGPTEPDFYQAGHTYTAAENPLYAWRFRCDTVTTHPEDGERTALGWRYFNGQWDAIAYGEDDWDLGQTRGLKIQTDTPR